jgi:hypothetical protein
LVWPAAAGAANDARSAPNAAASTLSSNIFTTPVR